ncbi:MAG: hypothetical protein LUO79_03220 [Methanomassiliicoccales archaeon]|nr:hypothetical protein [Methanomassiliicoccales archaeon]
MRDGLQKWLLQGDPWVRLRARLDLMDEAPSSPLVLADRKAVLKDPRIAALVREVSQVPWPPLTSHKSAQHPIHKLGFLVDIGLDGPELGLDEFADAVMNDASDEGPLRVHSIVSPSYGGTGKMQLSWSLCDAPLMSWAVESLGYEGKVLDSAKAHLLSLVRSNGWPCTVSENLRPFRGPGRKDDPCPFATLAMLKLLSLSRASRDSKEARIGTEALLSLWARSKERHPYMFYMGTDFRKLKAPLVWYDLLHVADVLTRFEHLRGDARLVEMCGAIFSKVNPDGSFTPESIWTAWKDWEFGQKKEPSRWLTYLVLRLQKRMAE